MKGCLSTTAGANNMHAPFKVDTHKQYLAYIICLKNDWSHKVSVWITLLCGEILLVLYVAWW